MKLTFHHLKLQNFMSFETAELGLSGNNFVLVSGTNQNETDGASSNGSGKSSLFEAIYWCLTGSTIRGSKDVVNHQFEKQGCFVELEFNIDSKEITLIRSKDHEKYKTNLIITVDGKEISGKGIRDSQKIFDETFPELSSDLIGSVIILGQGLPHRFTSNTPAGRKQVLEQLTNSDFMIESIKSKVTNREVELNSEIKEKELTVSLLSGKEQVINSSIKALEQKKEESTKEDIEATIKLIEQDKLAVEESVQEVANQISLKQENANTLYRNLTDAKSALSDLNNYRQVEISKVSEKYGSSLAELKAKISSLSSYITKAESVRDVCPTCGQKLVGVQKIDCSNEKEELAEATDQKQELELKQKFETDAVIAVYKEKIADKQLEVMQIQSEYEKVNSSIRTEQQSYTSETRKLQSINNQLEQLRVGLAKVDIDYDSQINELKGQLDQIHQDLLYTNNEIDQLNQHLAVIRKFQTFIKRDFRGYLLEQYITYLNQVAKKYCKQLFNSDQVLIQLDGNNLSISYSGKEYESLSGGEKQKVDLLVQFSIRDMLRSTLNFLANILILDEITDNLDIEGCQKLIEFVSSSFKDLDSIYFVSHRKDLDIPYDVTISVVKDNDGISRLN